MSSDSLISLRHLAMFRTPAKKDESMNGSRGSPRSAEKPGPSLPSVRRSIGEWESGKAEPQAKSPANPKRGTTPPTMQKVARTLETQRDPEAVARHLAKPGAKYPSLTAEARACLSKAKLHLGSSRNLKAEIKAEVLVAINRLYELVKEADKRHIPDAPAIPPGIEVACQSIPDDSFQKEVIQRLEKVETSLKEQLRDLESEVKKGFESMEGATYASVAAGGSGRKPQMPTALHSVVVTSKDETETGEEMMEKIRKVVNAKEEGLIVDRFRKAKDRKIIIGCRDAGEIRKVKEKIEKGEQFAVAEIKNKDPLVVFRDVLRNNTDEAIVKAIRIQNRNMLQGIGKADDRIEIRYRRNARNPHTAHIVARVSPIIWQRMTDAATIHIDMQRVRVEDQSPLIQCSRCLGYGHGKRFCRDAVDVCSHCGGQHLRTECAELQADTPPSCVNCVKTKMDKVDHNAFNSECPVRRRWEAMARSTIAYC